MVDADRAASFERMRDEAQPAAPANLVYQPLRVLGVRCKLIPGVVHEEMVALRAAPHVVYLLADEDQDVAVVALYVVHPDIVVCDDKEIEAGASGSAGDCRVCLGPIRIHGVDMQVASVLVSTHDRRLAPDSGRSRTAEEAPVSPMGGLLRARRPQTNCPQRGGTDTASGRKTHCWQHTEQSAEQRPEGAEGTLHKSRQPKRWRCLRTRNHLWLRGHLRPHGRSITRPVILLRPNSVVKRFGGSIIARTVSHLMTNEQVAHVFLDMAEILALLNEDVHRIRAYRRAAENILALGSQLAVVWEAAQLESIPGIGKTLANKIDELMRTGRLEAYEKLRGQVPAGVRDMLRVSGIGPKQARAFWCELGIDTVASLERAARAGELRGLPGIGARSERRILKAIEALGRTTLIMLVTLLVVLIASQLSASSALAYAAYSICFWSDRGPLVAQRVEADAQISTFDPEAALIALLEGPTDEEREEGLWTAIPAGTTLAGIEVEPGNVALVRLLVPDRGLTQLNHESFEVAVVQIGSTLEPLHWKDLRVSTWDAGTRTYVPLADFLPEISIPGKHEDRMAGLEPGVTAAYVGQPPAEGHGQLHGALTGKTVYVSAGHGWQWTGTDWRVQRIPYPLPPFQGPIIEDHNNAEAVNQYLLQYLWNAGAMVWPVRERDMNAAGVTVDNDSTGADTGYSQLGVWGTTENAGYAGGDYNWAETVAGSATSTATWTATLPSSGQYAVYVWFRAGSNRAPDARYTIHHAGGDTEVQVDQRLHGITWHYLGTYGFRAGEVARVTLDNSSQYAHLAVIADAIRFGGGSFDRLDGITTAAVVPPDKPWWEVATFYHAQRMGMSVPPNDVVARPLYAHWEHDGTGDDAVYVSWHSNGINGYQTYARGTMSIIHNGEGKPVTAGSDELRDSIHGELVNDLRIGWDPTWPGDKRSMNLGELRELWDASPQDALPGTLIEVAFHDHPGDAQALKEPVFNQIAARAVYQGIVKYFAEQDGVPPALVPEPPTRVRARNVGSGRVEVSWEPPGADVVDYVGDLATGYRLYTSIDGIGWSDAIEVGASTSFTLTGLSEGDLVAVRVSASNEGGESFPSETLAVRVGDLPGVLLVSGFDRLNSTMLVPDYDPTEGYSLRMSLGNMNSYDYPVLHGEAIDCVFDGASNEAVREGAVSLAAYDVVDWMLGEESAPDRTLDDVERELLRAFVAGGGALFLSGTEVGWDLEELGTDPSFYHEVLKSTFVGDDAESYTVVPAPGSIFEGMPPFSFDSPNDYDADYPDQMSPEGGSVASLTYEGSQGGIGAVQFADGCTRLVYLGFPFETIRPAHRGEVMRRVMDYLDFCLSPEVRVEITVPAAGHAYSAWPAFQGTSVAGGSWTLDRVELRVTRSIDGWHWSGSNWQPADTWVPAAGTTEWSYSVAAPYVEGNYSVEARAWTTEGMSSTFGGPVLFTYDATSPESTLLITPTGGITVAAVRANLEWGSVPPDGGSALAYTVRVDGIYYTATNTSYVTPPLGDGAHWWAVQVVDAAGNRSDWVTDTFQLRQHHSWLPVAARWSGTADEGERDLIVDGGFELGEGWTLNRLARRVTSASHSGSASARVGIDTGDEWSGGESVYSSVSQEVLLASGSTATLRMWVLDLGEHRDTGDWHYVGLRDEAGSYHSLAHWEPGELSWRRLEFDLTPYLGSAVEVYIGTYNDGDDNTASMYVDDVVLMLVE
jgi:hypothetical protein